MLKTVLFLGSLLFCHVSVAASIDAQWDLGSYIAFVRANATSQLQSAEGAVGVPIPAVIAFEASGSLVWMGTVEALNHGGAALLSGAANQAVSLNDVGDQLELIDAAGKNPIERAAGNPTLLTVVHTPESVRTTRAPLARILAADGRFWKVIRVQLRVPGALAD